MRAAEVAVTVATALMISFAQGIKITTNCEIMWLDRSDVTPYLSAIKTRKS